MTPGLSRAVDDLCLPVKVFYGHVLWLASRVQRLLISRMISVKRHICVAIADGIAGHVRVLLHDNAGTRVLAPVR